MTTSIDDADHPRRKFADQSIHVLVSVANRLVTMDKRLYCVLPIRTLAIPRLDRVSKSAPFSSIIALYHRT